MPLRENTGCKNLRCDTPAVGWSITTLHKFFWSYKYHCPLVLFTRFTLMNEIQVSFTQLGWVINKWCNWLSLFAFLAWKLVTFQSVSGSQVRGSQSEGSRHIYGETGLKGQEIKWLVSDRRWIEGLHETPRWKKYGLFWTLVCAKL